MNRERSFTTAFGSDFVEIRFADHESSTLMLESTDFLVPASPVSTPDFVVHVQTAGQELFPSQYTVAQDANSLLFCSPDFIGDFDLRRGHANITIPNSLDVRDHFKGKSLRPLWSILSGMRQITMMHAALIAREGNGVLIVGNSGRGKTTLATNASRNGWNLLSEDTTPVSCTSGAYRGFSFFASLSLTEIEVARQNLETLPRIIDRERQKRIYHFSDLADTYTFDYNSVSIQAIVALNGFTGEPMLQESSMTDILRHIVPSTLLQGSLRPPTLLRDITAMVKAVPSFSMTLGPVHSSNVDQLNALLRAVTS
jgi:hypothetical protein